ncbi:hypothetical protein PPROV_000842300 [Pycnococcus provasolii]|uniref:Probable ubiquitin carboxyl-terminal hydrolase MINDY-4 n=1 Tax=Pycnococcus provasolii TaxID=41880 RepID=A0A830HRT6_9CHLO|nr:hypothetical protein PPROV_000842300 [Pycnococcus provasolii]
MAIMSAQSHALVEALVREFLAKDPVRYGNTLASFELEAPRSPSSVTNRNVLRKSLGLEKVILKYKKQQADPSVSLPSTLHIIVSEYLRKAGGTTTTATAAAAAGGSENATSSETNPPAEIWPPPNPRSAARPGFAQPAAPTAMRDDEYTEPKPAAAPTKKPPAPQSRNEFDDEDDDEDPVIEELSAPRAPVSRRGGGLAGSPAQLKQTTESWAMEDMEDELSNFSLAPKMVPRGARRVVGDLTRPGTAPSPNFGGFGGGAGGGSGGSLSPSEARECRELCFAVCFGTPPDSWKQGFYFNPPSMADQQFGLVQDKGGPCGLLASVQARMVANAYRTHAPSSVDAFVRATCDPRSARSLLRDALADALVAAATADGASTTVALVAASGSVSFDAMLRSAHVTRVPASSRAEVARELERSCLPAWTSKDGFGMVQFLLSAVLTRGVATCRGEMDEPTNSLLAMHGYCTQDLVNLLTLGRCVSNVFDGDMDVGGMRMRGVPSGGDVGLLTLFEWYGSHEVGKRLKCPSTPTWVICSESHFSVLFGLAEPRRAGASFAGDLLYYDGLHRQDRLLRLTLSSSPTGGHTQRIGRTAEERARFADHGREAVPPLEFVLETKWQGVDVDWNGAEKIL